VSLSPVAQIVVKLPVFLLAIVLHELAHGYSAYLLGDDTAKRAGRLTLSPLAHLDPLGTIVFVISAYFGIGFGWAKPVPISVHRMRHPRRDEIIVTLAGPTSNFLQALAWVALLSLVTRYGAGPAGRALAYFCVMGVAINVVLMMFNLLPIPPLDGSHVALRILGVNDPHLADRLAPLGFLVLFILVSTPGFDWFYLYLVQPILRWLLPGGIL